MIGVLLLVLGFVLGLIDTAIGMGYGTIGTPVLLIAGIPSFLAVPAILFSQTMEAMVGAFGHARLKNLDLKRGSKDIDILIRLSCFGIGGTIIAVLVAINIPKVYVTIYIGLLVIAMGIIMIMKSRMKFSWEKVDIISFISGFNKAISGGGYGPIATTGLVAAGHAPKNSIAITLLSVVIINITAFFVYMASHLIVDYLVPICLSVGAVAGAFFGPLIARRAIANQYGRKIIGICAIILGMLTIALYI
ncbi:MAG: sulfite exporter TauE/SafE family protein [Candidatus Micrarchaeia archaeon]